MVELFFYEPLVLCGTCFHQTSHLYFNLNGTIRTPAIVKYTCTTAKHTGDDHLVHKDKDEEPGDCADERHLTVVEFERAPRVTREFVARAVYCLW